MTVDALAHKLRNGWDLVRASGRSFARDRGALIAAAIGFYVLLAVAPLTFVALAAVGSIFGTERERTRLADGLAETLGYEPSGIINQWLLTASEAPGLLSAVGIGVALLMSTRLFTQLQKALNEIWEVPRKRPSRPGARVRDFVRRRLVAFAMLAGTGLLLVGLVVGRSLTSVLYADLVESTSWTRATIDVVQLAVSIAVVALIAAFWYRILPDARVPWRSAWTGALLASLLFNVGIVLFGMYVGWIAEGQTFGAAGAFVFLLVWLYYSAQAFLLGAELAHVHGERR